MACVWGPDFFFIALMAEGGSVQKNFLLFFLHIFFLVDACGSEKHFTF